MPPVEILPEDLKKLAFRNAVELTHARWDSDVQVLVKALRSYVQAREPAAARSGPSGFVIAALGSVLVLALAGYLWLQKSSEGAAREVEQTGLGDPPIVRQASGGQTAPAAPVESDSASSPVPVPSPSGTSSTVISSVVVVGPSEGIYSTYDESGQKYLGSRSLGNALALFPGNYLIEVSGIRKPLTVREGQRASLAVGSAVVVGPSEGIYSTYDESGQEYLGSRSLGNALALFPGNYLIEVNGVRRPVTVWSAQQAQVHWPSRS
jgi:hypothetical protein